MIKELDTVVLKHDIKEKGLVSGDMGVVVHTYPDKDAFEIEFSNGEGKAVAVLTLKHDELRTVNGTDIFHAREIA